MSEWPMVKLGEVCRISIGKTPARKEPRYWGDGLPWLSIKDMNQGPLLNTTSETITDTALSELNISPYPAGTVLFSFKLSIGKVGITTKPMFTNEAIAAIEPHNINSLDKPYLAEALRFIGQSLEGNAAVMGITLNKKSLAEINIPLPPLGEQKRIAEILGRVNYAIQDLESQIQFIESLPTKIFELFFNEESRQGKRPSSTITNFISNTQYGTSKKAAESGAIPILRMGNITYSGQIDRSDLKYIDLADKEIDKYTLRDGDLLFNRTNSVELVGKTAVFEENLDQKVSYAGYLIRARTNADSNPYYVSGYLNSPSGKAQLRLRAKSIVGMANINAKEFLSLRVPAATKSEQDDFAHFYLECKLARKLFSQKLALLQELQRSLSARAFAGLL